MLAETFRKRWFQATAVSYNADFRGYQNDVKLGGVGIRERASRFLFFLWAINHFDIFHFFWGISMWSFWRFHLLDLPLLRLLGKKVVVHFRGLDIVDIKYFDYRREKSRGESVVRPQISRPSQKRRVKTWLKYANRVLVSEPDLFEVVPEATLSPQVIDLDYWKSTRRPLSEEDGVFRFVHAPSSRRKKGTDFIEKAIAELQAKGYKVELVLAEKLPHHKIRELYEISDVGIDQVLYGWHGKVSVELMALGKPVVCFIEPDYLKYRPDLPIVSATPMDLTQVLEGLIVNSDLRRALADAGKQYVAKYHDVERIADQLLGIYGITPKSMVINKIEDAKMW